MKETNYKLKLKIARIKKATKDGRTFVIYRTEMLLTNKEDGKVGKYWIDVRFDKNIPADKIQLIKGKGYIVTSQDDVIAPEVYEIKPKTDKNGVIKYEADGTTPKKEYPHVYIKNFESFIKIERKAVQSQFVIDEEETESSEIE